MGNIDNRSLETLFIKTFSKEISDDISKHLKIIKEKESRQFNKNPIIREHQTFINTQQDLSVFLNSVANKHDLYMTENWHVYMKVYSFDINLIKESESQDRLLPRLTVLLYKDYIRITIDVPNAIYRSIDYRFNSYKMKLKFEKIELAKLIISSILTKRLEITDSINGLYDYYYVNTKNKTIAETGIKALCSSIFADTSVSYELMPNYDNPFIFTIRFTDKDEESICAANFNVMNVIFRYKEFCQNPQAVMLRLQEIKAELLSQ